MLFASALLVVFGHRWARIPAALLLAASIWYLAREVFAADYGRIPGGSGPDANPMAGVIYLILGAAAIIGIIATLFLVWLFTLRTPLNK
jgi:hypothetical protein